MKIPFYGSNYSAVIGAPYSVGFGGSEVEFKTLLKFMSNDFIQKYKLVDGRKVAEYITKNKASDAFLTSTFDLDGKSYSGADILTAIKLVLPSLWNCNYFFWDIGAGTHHGIDVLLPKGTPLPAFQSGKVVKVKQWDGVKKDDGNCVVVQTVDNVFICYEHLDTISVTNGQQVNQGDTIGTCGKTGNATQYHLHFQVDSANAKFHPFWSAKLEEVKSSTMDGISYLRKIYGLEGTSVASASAPANVAPAQPTTPASNPPSNNGGDLIGDIMGEINKTYK